MEAGAGDPAGQWSCCLVLQGQGQESQGQPGLESGEGCEGQQERLLQVHKEHKEDQGKRGPLLNAAGAW